MKCNESWNCLFLAGIYSGKWKFSLGVQRWQSNNSICVCRWTPATCIWNFHLVGQVWKIMKKQNWIHILNLFDEFLPMVRKLYFIMAMRYHCAFSLKYLQYLIWMKMKLRKNNACFLRLICVCSSSGAIHLLRVKLNTTQEGNDLNTNVEDFARVDLEGDIFSSPVMIGGRIFIGCRDDYVHCVVIGNLNSIRNSWYIVTNISPFSLAFKILILHSRNEIKLAWAWSDLPGTNFVPTSLPLFDRAVKLEKSCTCKRLDIMPWFLSCQWILVSCSLWKREQLCQSMEWTEISNLALWHI